MTQTVIAWVDRVLGPSEVVGVPIVTGRREGTDQYVVEVLDAHGRRWFAKRASTLGGWRLEVRAYRRWVPTLGTAAPWLHSADQDLRTLLVSALPGAVPRAMNPEVYPQAGALLRRLHQADAPKRRPMKARELAMARLSRLHSSTTDLLSHAESTFIREQIRTLGSLPLGQIVPCHGDYKPHNWLMDDAGILRVIDFGNSVRANAAFDFSKLFYGVWWKQPDLAGLFFDGYGRRPSDDELAFVQARVALYTVRDISLGRQREVSRHETYGRARLADLMAGHQVQCK